MAEPRQHKTRVDRTSITRVSARGQTVVPREVRRLFDISAGSRLRWEVRGRVIRVYPVLQDPIGSSRGYLANQGLDLGEFVASRHKINAAG